MLSNLMTPDSHKTKCPKCVTIMDQVLTSGKPGDDEIEFTFQCKNDLCPTNTGGEGLHTFSYSLSDKTWE